MSNVYQIVEWLNEEDCDWAELSKNPHPGAIEMLRQNPEKIDYYNIAGNPAAIELIEEFIHRGGGDAIEGFWQHLCSNSAAFHLFDKIPRRDINKYQLSQNPAAIDYLLRNPHKIDWEGFYLNTHPEAIRIITEREREYEECEDDISREEYETHETVCCSLCENPATFHLLHLDMLGDYDWSCLCKNPATAAIKLLRKNPETIHWHLIARNPGAIEMLREKFMVRTGDEHDRENQNSSYWWRKNLWANPAIFERVMPAFKNAAGADDDEE